MSKMQTFLLRYASGRCQVHAHTKKNITPKAYANDKRQQELSLFFFFPEFRMVSPSQQLGRWTQQRAKQGTGLAWHSTSHRI